MTIVITQYLRPRLKGYTVIYLSVFNRIYNFTVSRTTSNTFLNQFIFFIPNLKVEKPYTLFSKNFIEHKIKENIEKAC